MIKPIKKISSPVIRATSSVSRPVSCRVFFSLFVRHEHGCDAYQPCQRAALARQLSVGSSCSCLNCKHRIGRVNNKSDRSFGRAVKLAHLIASDAGRNVFNGEPSNTSLEPLIFVWNVINNFHGQLFFDSTVTRSRGAWCVTASLT